MFGFFGCGLLGFCFFWGGEDCLFLIFQIVTDFTVLEIRIGGKENILLFQISTSFQ